MHDIWRAKHCNSTDKGSFRRQEALGEAQSVTPLMFGLLSVGDLR